MIIYNLKCRKGHAFEAWFRDSTAYDEQAAGRKIECPTCGSRKIEKGLMTPRLGKGRRHSEPAQDPESRAAAERRRQLEALRRHVEENFDHVGERFAEEARKIHYGETDPRNIYGQTSGEEAKALKEEGVSFGQLPWLPRQDS